jgi:predicted nucleic acid-binding protein
MIFVDTGVWFALAVPTYANHVRLQNWNDSNSEPLVTTDYVLDETLTLLRYRGENRRALVMGERLLNGTAASVHMVDLSSILAAWEIFRKFGDKQWSFTDCVSYVVMQRLGISSALSLDQHFRQFGTVSVLP